MVRIAATALAVLALGSLTSGVDALPLAAPTGLSAAAAHVSVAQGAAYVCGRWSYGGYWERRCWVSYGPFWPPTWRGSGWHGPGWYGRGWRKHYFYGYGY